ncbi:Transcriptional regulatory protein OmpR [uncultured Defluviicoccus sp.]|uniref:Transcriptional regulatory protein OmpR n=1 Tax=metagenome TaxID=256318 RepID=A0A380TAP4_9ZZZZ|nr:Transcriptional regulatory protein OmpR [uncultured Defluviicoccus sp.]
MIDRARLVVVDDEADVRAMLEEYLTCKGYAVRSADSGVALRRLLASEPADLVLLDINMPGETGLSLARYIRASGPCGIIMVTAADDLADRLAGLETGADDYVTKPFDPRELLARIRSVLRRMAETGPDAASEAPEPAATPRERLPLGRLQFGRLQFGRCLLDLDRRLLIGPDGEEIGVTAMEFDLLQAFAARPNRALSRDQLSQLAHNRGWDPLDRSLDIRITRLRRKIETDPANPQTILTVRGVGYMFVAGAS